MTRIQRLINASKRLVYWYAIDFYSPNKYTKKKLALLFGVLILETQLHRSSNLRI